MAGVLAGIIDAVLGEAIPGIREWARGKQEIAKAQVEATVQEVRARGELAAYRVKSEVEWDLQWAAGAQKSWKDEWILILWSIPTVSIFVPFLRPYVIDGFMMLKTFSPDAPTWFIAGWGIIFAATFGMKSALAWMLPDKAAKVAAVFGGLADDIPAEAVKAATAAITKK